jgi:hypothetical protein
MFLVCCGLVMAAVMGFAGLAESLGLAAPK